MIRFSTGITLFLSTLICSFLLFALGAWRAQYWLSIPNPLDEYVKYQPGASFGDLIATPGCQVVHEVWYDMNTDFISLFCEFPRDVHVRFILVYPDDQMRVKSSHYYFKNCAISAGDMLLWYQGHIVREWRNSRHIIWNGGDSWTWYNRRRTFWSPHICVYYARFM